MKKFLMTCMAAGTLLSATAQTVAPAIPRDEKIEQRVEEILGKMTLEEKIGQMCELTIDVIQKRVNPFEGIDMKNPDVKALKKVLKKYGIEKEFDLSGGVPSQDVMVQMYMRIQGIEAQKGWQMDEAKLDSVIANGYEAVNDELVAVDIGLEPTSDGECIACKKGDTDLVGYVNEIIAGISEEEIDQMLLDAQILAGIIEEK